MLPISIQFQAYIPKSLGKSLLSYFEDQSSFNLLSNKEEFIRKLKAKDFGNVTWLPEPFNSLSDYYFATDDVDFHNHHSEHTSRLSLHAEIKPEKIGNYNLTDINFKHKRHKNMGGFNSQHSGDSHRVHAYIKRVSKGHIDTGTTFIDSGEFEYIGICSDSIDSMISLEAPLDVSIFNSKESYFSSENNDVTTIKVKGSANYPFLGIIAPNIDFELSIVLHKNLDSKSITINVSGSHNEFPAYELIINDCVAYKYNPAIIGYTGPSLYNLSVSKYFSARESIRLDECQVNELLRENKYGW